MTRLEFLKWKIKRLKKWADQLQNQMEDLNAIIKRGGAVYGELFVRYAQINERLRRILKRIEDILKEMEENNEQNK